MKKTSKAVQKNNSVIHVRQIIGHVMESDKMTTHFHLIWDVRKVLSVTLSDYVSQVILMRGKANGKLEDGTPLNKQEISDWITRAKIILTQLGDAGLLEHPELHALFYKK